MRAALWQEHMLASLVNAGTGLCLWSENAKSEGRGEQSLVQTKAECRAKGLIQHGPDILPALSLLWERQRMLGWQFEKILSLRGDALQKYLCSHCRQIQLFIHIYQAGFRHDKPKGSNYRDYSSNIITPIRSSHCNSCFSRLTKHSSVLTALFIFSERISVRPNHY